MYRDPIGHRIKTINNLMRKTMDKKTGQRPDRVTLMHCWIIGFVQDREDSGLDTFPKDIEKEFSINRSTTSEMLKLMCKKGMIEREEVEYDARLKKTMATTKIILNLKLIIIAMVRAQISDIGARMHIRIII